VADAHDFGMWKEIVGFIGLGKATGAVYVARHYRILSSSKPGIHLKSAVRLLAGEDERFS